MICRSFQAWGEFHPIKFPGRGLAVVNKNDLVATVAERTGLTKRDSEKAVNAVVDGIQDALAKGDRVSLVGFGTFEIRERGARVGRNPQTGQSISIPASKVPAFKAGKQLRDSVLS